LNAISRTNYFLKLCLCNFNNFIIILKTKKVAKRIFITALVAGTLDIIAACLQAYISRGTAPGTVLKYIASGVLGKDAFAGGAGIMLLGLLFHFLIATACTMVFFIVYKRMKILHGKILLNSILIAITAWTVTTQVIIPLSEIQKPPFQFNKALIAIAILFVCIGLPIAISANNYFYKSKQMA